MDHIIPIKDILRIEATLNVDQKNFLEKKVQNNIYNNMVSNLVDSGKIRYLENPTGEDLNQLGREYRVINRNVSLEKRAYVCDECNHRLKYQYVVQNTNDGSVVKLGSTCLARLTGMDDRVVNALVKIFDDIDLMYEDILWKYERGIGEEHKRYLEVPELPATIRSQLLLGLPLADIQLDMISSAVNRYEYQLREKQRAEELAAALFKELEVKKMFVEDNRNKLNVEQMEYFDVQTLDQQVYIIEHIDDKEVCHENVDLSTANISDDVKRRLELKLPLHTNDGYYLQALQRKAAKEIMEKERRQSIVDGFNAEQLEFYQEESAFEQQFILKNFGKKSLDFEIGSGKVQTLDERLQTKLRLSMPLHDDEYPVVMAAISKNSAQHNHWHYDELIRTYGHRLERIKAYKDQAREICPKKFKNLVGIMEEARSGKEVRGNEVKMIISNIENLLKLSEDTE